MSKLKIPGSDIVETRLVSCLSGQLRLLIRFQAVLTAMLCLRRAQKDEIFPTNDVSLCARAHITDDSRLNNSKTGLGAHVSTSPNIRKQLLKLCPWRHNCASSAGISKLFSQRGLEV